MIPTTRRGFTLIELLIVVAIIAVLVALLLPALALLRKKARTAATESRIQQVTLALTHYLDRYRVLGDAPTATSDDFKKKPYFYLYKRYRMMHEEPLLELPIDQIAVGAGTYTTPASPMDGEHILDCFPAGGHANLLQFEVANKPVLGQPTRFYTDTIFIRSTAGTQNNPSDDIIWCYTVSPADWKLTQSRDWFELKGSERDFVLSQW